MNLKKITPILAILLFGVFAILTIAEFLPQVQKNSAVITGDVSEQLDIETYTSVTEEEVIKALAYTYNDQELEEAINKKTTLLSKGKTFNQFGAVDYSDFTNGEFGGIYVDEQKNTLYICYTDGELYEKIKALNEKNGNVLYISPTEKIGLKVNIKTVKNSYHDLLTYRELLYNLVTERKEEFQDISGWGTNIIENKLRISLFETETYKETQEKLSSIFKKDTIIFEIVSPENKLEYTTLGTRGINE